MNKKFKIATAAVSIVMAGTMAFGMFGCSGGSNDDDGDNGYSDVDISNVTLKLDIGDATNRSVSFKYGELLSGSVTLPDGETYTSSSLKPAWAAFESMVGCKFEDVFSETSGKVDAAENATASGSTLADRDIITDSANNISTYSSDLLDLSEYLDDMPNYKAFLEANPIVRLSLTSSTTSGAMYYAPYFDGNNDIEKYELFKTNWVESLLDAASGSGNTDQTWAATMKTKSKTETETSITSYMGTTGSYHTDVLDKDGEKLSAGIDIRYDKALVAAKNASSELGSAINTAAGKTYDGTSGNIVDLMNFAINAKSGAVTGAQLLKILQEYIKVAYYVGGTDTPFYTQTGYKLSDVFVGNSAAWDVDLYAALGRVLVTNPSLLKSGSSGSTIGGTNATSLANLYLLAARQNNMQRMIDTVSMIGQLYGVRGLESKNLYSYIDANGTLQDARGDEATYDAMNAFSAFYAEGLVAEGASGSDGDQAYYGGKWAGEALSTYDYVNTQTGAGFQLSGNVASGTYALEDGFNYTPIITPVSKWDEDSSGSIETDEYFRFTESWRTTKDTGFCVPKANVLGTKNKAKLAAVLKFIDTMFTNDGMIVLTYGPKSSSATAHDGFWYNEEATDAQVEAGTYFTFQGKKLYSEVQYSGVYQPTIESNVMAAYYGQTVNNTIFNGTGVTYAGAKLSNVTTSGTAVAKNDTISGDVYAVKSDGSYEKITGKYPAAGYVVEDSTVTGSAAKYYVDKDGYILNKSGAKQPLISDTVSQWTTNATLNYTNFARYVIGSALAIGNKLQSFEFQLTSQMGRTGALVVDNAMNEGVVKHTVNEITSNPWYIAVPTLLPYTNANKTDLTGSCKDLYTNGQNDQFSNNKNNQTNFLWEIIKNGYNASNYSVSFNLNGLTGTASASAIVTRLKDEYQFTKYLAVKQGAWTRALNYYNTKLTSAD